MINKLINALRCLPGVGPKTAQRMAFHLLERGRDDGLQLAATLNQALTQIGHCQSCRTFTEAQLCNICANPKRDTKTICIVETPADIIAVEGTNSYHGKYFVLMGHLSPIDGIGPNEIGIPALIPRLNNQNIQEVIIATNPTVEGDATAHYIADIVHAKNIRCTRLAHGIPMGGELEYIDSNTLARAFSGRTEL
jgi:recombination protein RecR